MNENNRYKLLKSDITLSSVLLILAYGIITYLVTVMLLPVVALSYFNISISESAVTIITLVAQFFICMPIAIAIMRGITGIPLKSIFRKTPKFAVTFGKSMMIFCAFMFVGMIISTLISELISLAEVKSTMPDIIENPTSITEIIITAICVVLVGPIAEEIIFRGFILKLLSRHNAWFAVIVTSFMFAVYHCNIDQGVNSFILGIFLSITAIKTGSIIIPALLHIANNFLSYSFSFLPFDNTGFLIFVLTYFSALFVIGLLGVIIYRKQFSLKALPKEFSGRVCAKAFFSSPAMWIMVVVFGLMIALSFTVIA